MSVTNTNRILNDLQENGRSSITDLVNRLGLSRLDVVAALLVLEQRGQTRAIVSAGQVEATND